MDLKNISSIDVKKNRAIISLIQWYESEKETLLYNVKSYSMKDVRDHAIMYLVSTEFKRKFDKQMTSDDADEILKIASKFDVEDDMKRIISELVEKSD